MPATHRLAAVFVISALAGCAGTPTRTTSKSASATTRSASADAGQINALYARLDADAGRFTEARAADEPEAAEKSKADARAALDDLLAASTQCQSLPGCDTQRFVAAFDHLLRQDSGLLGEDSANPAPDDGDAQDEAGETSPVAEAIPEVRRSVAMLKGRQLSDVIALNDPVKVALELWLTQLRPNLMRAYENYEYLRFRMWPEYHKAGLPEALLFGMLAKESGGKVHAVSRSGASGPLQFMYATGARFGLGTVDGFDQRFDPQLAARANAAYLNEQLAVFNDNLELVLGAYNGGEGAMQRLVNRNPDASFWDPKIYFDLSAETREYVPMVLAAAWLFLHPERYHLKFPHLENKPAALVLARAASIDELTICLGQEGNPDGWFRTLRNLNPKYEPQQTLPAGTRIELPALLASDYEKNCTGGKWVDLASELHSATAPAVPARFAWRHRARHYTVRRGETLGGIARKVGCASLGEIARANHIKAPVYALRAGQRLRIPACRRR